MLCAVVAMTKVRAQTEVQRRSNNLPPILEGRLDAPLVPLTVEVIGVPDPGTPGRGPPKGARWHAGTWPEIVEQPELELCRRAVSVAGFGGAIKIIDDDLRRARSRMPYSRGVDSIISLPAGNQPMPATPDSASGKLQYRSGSAPAPL